MYLVGNHLPHLGISIGVFPFGEDLDRESAAFELLEMFGWIMSAMRLERCCLDNKYLSWAW